MTEPVSLDQIKTHLRLDPGGTGDVDEDARQDVYLAGLVTAARVASEKHTGRVLASRDLVLAIDGFPRAPTWGALEYPDYCASGEIAAFEVITLPAGEIASISSITYLDDTGTLQTVDPSTWASDLINDPARIFPLQAWPLAPAWPGSVRIEYSAAILDTDDATMVAQAILLTVGTWYRNRESTQVDARGVPMEIPQSAKWLLELMWDPARS